MNKTSPYEILGVSKDVTAGQLKQLWHKQIYQHHPDNGGRKELFLHLQTAFLSVVEDLKQAVSKEAVGRKMSTAEFRQKVSTMNPKDISRTKEDIMRERYTVNKELDDIQPIFEAGFNNNAFQRLWLEKNPAVKQPTTTPPISRVSSKLKYTSVGGKNYSSEHASYEKAFSGGTNPKKVDPRVIRKLQAQKNITKVDKMSIGDAQGKIADYRSTKFKRNKERMNTDLSYQLRQTDLSTIPEPIVSTWSMLPPGAELAMIPGMSMQISPRATHEEKREKNVRDELVIALINREAQLRKKNAKKLKKYKKKLKRQQQMIAELRRRYNHQ